MLPSYHGLGREEVWQGAVEKADIVLLCFSLLFVIFFLVVVHRMKGKEQHGTWRILKFKRGTWERPACFYTEVEDSERGKVIKYQRGREEGLIPTALQALDQGCREHSSQDRGFVICAAAVCSQRRNTISEQIAQDRGYVHIPRYLACKMCFLSE